MKIQKLLYCSVVAAIAANISITAFAADFTVPTNGTFAQAVTAANARAAGAPTYTIDISGNQTGVTGTFSTSTSISGAGATLTLTGSSLNFSGSAVTNTLNNLNLTGGATPSGGAILNSAGTLTLNNVTVLNNSITAPAGGGGGIHNDASIVITGSTFRGNNGNSAGGGLHNDGPAKIANTLFTENQANNGGGIYNISAMDVTGSNFLNNRAVGGPGGAIHSIHTSGVVTISDSTFTGNTTNSDAGAVYTTGDMNITRSTFDGNSAPSTTVGNAGGAISSRANALNITDVTFKNNSAGSYGGAVAVRSGTTTINGNTSFTNNTSGNGGGAISNGDSFGWGTVSTLVVNSGATFSGNTAKGGTDPISGGGAIGNYNSNLTVNNGVSFSGNSSASSGGAIYIHNQRGGSANILGANFDKNTATQNGGAINVQYGDLTVGSGSSFTNNSATQSGGAINKVSGVLTVEGNTIFSNNTAANGGAIYNSSYDLNLDTTKGDITFTGNKASTSGSDIQTSDTVNIVGDSNTVSMDGGVAGYGSINKNGANTLLLKESSDNTKFIGTFTQNAGTTTVYTDKFMAGTNNINNSNLNLFHSMPTVNINNLNLSNANVNSINNTTNTYNIGTINLTGTNNFTVDVDGAAAKSDRFNVASTSGSGTLHVKNFNMMGAPTDKVIDVEVFTGSAAHMHTTDVTQLATPIYMYNVTTLDPEVRGQADESGHGKGFYRFYTSENKNITDGSAPPQFNPQVHRGRVSTAAMYSSQLAMNNTLFDHVYIDSYEPIARGRKNQYAAGTGIFAPFQFDQLNGGLKLFIYIHLSQEMNA